MPTQIGAQIDVVVDDGDNLGEIDDGEYRVVDVGEETRQDVAFSRGERFYEIGRCCRSGHCLNHTCGICTVALVAKRLQTWPLGVA